jgi:hypothetical protein
MKASKKVKKGRGGTRAKPADMGVSMEDILFMAEMVRECTAMRVRTAQHKSDSDRHKKEVKNLEKDLEAERACVTRANTEIDRMKREGGRHTLENQVEEWRKKAEDCKTKAEEVRRASKTAVQKALKERDKARKDKNGFVQELQKNMECGGVQMYCIERGDEGLFIPKNQMHVQLKAWEEQQEESWKEIGVLKGKLLQAVQMIRETKGSLSQMECHAAALEQAVRAISIKGKKEKEQLVVKVAEEKKKTDRMASKWQTEKKKAAADTKKTRGAMETAEAEINSIEAALAAAKLHLHDSSRRHEDQVKKLRRVNDSRLAGLEKFRLQATRALERTHKNQNKDWSKVSHASHQNLFCFFCVRSCHFVFASAFSSTLNLHLRLTISANKIISNLPCLTPPPPPLHPHIPHPKIPKERHPQWFREKMESMEETIQWQLDLLDKRVLFFLVFIINFAYWFSVGHPMPIFLPPPFPHSPGTTTRRKDCRARRCSKRIRARGMPSQNHPPPHLPPPPSLSTGIFISHLTSPPPPPPSPTPPFLYTRDLWTCGNCGAPQNTVGIRKTPLNSASS